ncbi:MAG: CPBP family intramembrane glutamic endopeptidase [Phycisphaerales bacterium]
MTVAPVDGRYESSDQRRRRLWIELAVTACVAVVPDLCYSLLPYDHGTARTVVADAGALLARSIGVSAPLLYMMWRSGDRWSRFGLVRWRWRVDGPLTLLLITASIIAGFAWAGSMALMGRGTPIEASSPVPMQAASLRALQAAAHVANGFAEEVAIWGVLYTRFQELVGRAVPAIIACALAFASYHVYQGVPAALGVMVFGLVHGVVFACTRRLWPLVAAHALHNIWIDWSAPLLDGYAL